ncbi:helix-turn-helix domain-containing protein [Ectopseudomonas mendocina]|uniref:helix-turn-helix domain-containing protein n=1 Tax=Ectopseudomonas mendocina TaxID=300 RepID=UPI001F36065D|nr:helix-turn-helix domain-containing protein [Pseudomonas mendocina]
MRYELQSAGAEYGVMGHTLYLRAKGTRPSIHPQGQADFVHAGVTPARLLLHLRLESACQSLEAGEASLKRVAQRSGFVNVYNLRQAFARALGVTPGEYRQRFCR